MKGISSKALILPFALANLVLMAHIAFQMDTAQNAALIVRNVTRLKRAHAVLLSIIKIIILIEVDA
jgi:hypothetical protein